MSPQKTLFDFLSKLDTCQPIISNLGFLQETARKMVIEKHSEGVRVLEIRFAPTYIDMSNSVSYDDILEAIERGVDAGINEVNNEIAVGLIVIAVGAAPLEFFEKTVDWAIKVKHRIVGFDIAGVEQNLSSFTKYMDMIHSAGINITCHAAEDMVTGKPENVLHASKLLHAKRIGHGIQIFRCPELMDYVKERDIHLEVNPQSNLYTGAVASLKEHPLRKLFDEGVSVSISSDDPALLDMYLNDDYRAAVEDLNFTRDELILLNVNALCHSFLHDDIVKKQIETFFLDDILSASSNVISKARSLLSLHKRLPAIFPLESNNLQPTVVETFTSSASIQAQ